MMLWKCCTQYASKFGNSAVAIGLEKVTFHSNPKEKQSQIIFKLPHNCTHFPLAKSCSKFSKPGFNSTWTKNPDVLAGYKNGRETRHQIANIHWIIRKTREFRKTSISASLTMLKHLTLWITTDCRKFFKRWEYQTTLPASLEICIQVKKQQLEPDIKQRTGSKLGKEYFKAVYCHLAYLTYMQSTSHEMLDWMKHKLKSILPGEISITSDRQPQ